MLEITAVIKSTPFKFTDLDGTETELKVVQRSIGDTMELVKVQTDIGAIDPNEDTQNLIAKTNKIMFSNLMFTVKRADDGEYFWKDIDDHKKYPREILESILEVVLKLNPVDSGDSDTKKN